MLDQPAGAGADRILQPERMIWVVVGARLAPSLAGVAPAKMATALTKIPRRA